MLIKHVPEICETFFVGFHAEVWYACNYCINYWQFHVETVVLCTHKPQTACSHLMYLYITLVRFVLLVLCVLQASGVPVTFSVRLPA